MLDLSFVRENLDLVRSKLADRGAGIDLAPFEKLDSERRAILRDAESTKQRRNKSNESISFLKKEGKDASAVIAEMKELSGRIKEDDARLKEPASRRS
jgi:seryl-tRNA synthetase